MGDPHICAIVVTDCISFVTTFLLLKKVISSLTPSLLLSPKSCIAFWGPRERSCPLAEVFAFSLCFQPEQQTALAAFLTVTLLDFEQSRFFEVTDPAADGGG